MGGGSYRIYTALERPGAELHAVVQERACKHVVDMTDHLLVVKAAVMSCAVSKQN